MTLIKCENCNKIISDKAKKCPKCGYLFNYINLDIVIIVYLIVFFSIVIAGIIINNNRLICIYNVKSNVGTTKYKITYIFKNDELYKIKGYQYVKSNSSSSISYLWKVTNDNQKSINEINGIKFKADYTDDNEIIMKYTMNVNIASEYLDEITELSGIKGINIYDTKEEIKDIFEENNYKCK